MFYNAIIYNDFMYCKVISTLILIRKPLKEDNLQRGDKRASRSVLSSEVLLYFAKKNQAATQHCRAERLSSLALPHLHRDIDIRLEDIVDEFARRHPRRLKLADILS